MSSSCRSSVPQTKILIHIYLPGRCIAQVNVVPSLPIREIQSILRSDRVTLIFNGIVLSPSNSFDFYGIRERDFLVAVPTSPDPAFTSRWISLSQDTESFRERLECLLNQGTAMEAARLRDFQFTKIERRPRTFRKFTANCQGALDFPPAENPSHCSVVAGKGQAPSVAPLPIFWSEPRSGIIVAPGQKLDMVKDDQFVSDREAETLRP
jgi:hypothetical protein